MMTLFSYRGISDVLIEVGLKEKKQSFSHGTSQLEQRDKQITNFNSPNCNLGHSALHVKPFTTTDILYLDHVYSYYPIYLRFNNFSINLNASRSKFHTYGRFRLQVEFISRKPR